MKVCCVKSTARGKKMKIKGDFVHREIAGEHILVPIGSENMNYNGLFSLSEVAARIWEILPECDTQEQIVNTILNEYEVERETAETDVKEFLDQLKKMRIL